MLAALRALIVAVLVTAFAAGCVAVRPWEREALASRVMRPDADALERRTDDRVYENREGSIGSGAVAGGGCGCN